jgi:hypothetical protein
MFAQALAEYSLIAAIMTAVDSAWSTATETITNPDSRLIYVAGFAVLAWMTIRLLRR